MIDFLDNMARQSRERVAATNHNVAELRELIEQQAQPPKLQLDRFDLIAEIKKTSPAEGALGAGVDVAAQAQAYEQGGASAVSVLTEPRRFHGELADMSAAAAAIRKTPVMRKDFLIDPVQIYEARAGGAGGVLLIAAMLEDEQLATMTELALALNLFVLIEAFDRDDIRRMNGLLARDKIAVASHNQQVLFGINTRNLRTLAVDTDRLERLIEFLPRDVTKVAESGVTSAEAAGAVARMGYNAALVGTALMRAAKPDQLIAAMLAAGRAPQS